MPRSHLYAWLTVAFLATGCGGTLMPQRSAADAEAIEELKRRVLDLQRQATVHEEEVGRLQQQVAELEKELAAAKAPAPAPSESRKPVPPVTETYQAPVIEERDLEPPPPARSVPPRSTARPAPPPPTRNVEAPPARPILEAPPGSAAPVSAAAQEIYDRGYTLYHQERYADAEREFLRFLASYGDSELGDNAQYWIGEARYARRDYEGALEAFRETIERFPAGNKVPDALFKAGQCFEAQGDRDSALETYREVSERFPDSAASARAEERIRQLSGN